MLNYYQLPGIPDFSTERQVKKAYREKCRQYHPYLMSNLGSKLQTVAKVEMYRANKAYEILRKPDKKRIYDVWLLNAKKDKYLKRCSCAGWSMSRRRMTSILIYAGRTIYRFPAAG